MLQLSDLFDATIFLPPVLAAALGLSRCVPGLRLPQPSTVPVRRGG